MLRIRAHTQTNIYRSLQYFVPTRGENDVHILSKNKIEETVVTRSGRRIKLGKQLTAV